MKVMIVDDEPLILAEIENIIINEFSGCMEIVKAFDGIDALDKLKYFIPDLIITDICMPKMSGLELIEWVLKIGICSQFIIITGYADFEYARRAIQYKALDYILKPIDKVKLVGILENVSKKIDQEQDELVKQELNKIREIMFYDNQYEEFFLEKKIISTIFPFSLFIVILIQIEDNFSELNVTSFDTQLPHFFNKYQIFLLPHKKQIVILSNFEQIISDRDLYKELSCLKIKNNIKIKNIGISTISDRIDSIHTLYNDALRHLLREKDSIGRYSESVSKMLDYINKNYMQDISLDDIAEIVNLHPNYASSLFKKENGTSFIQYLNSYRIMKAKDFIKMNAELPLEKIAERVGYENSCHFIKVFKKYCNVTPGEYRNKMNSFI